MIKVPNIKGSPESTPKKYVGVHSDDLYFYFFDDEIEMELFYNSLPIDNSGKKAEIELQAEELFYQALEDNWYTKFDIYLYANKGEQKAVDILAYYEYLWETIETNFNQDNYNFKLPNFEQWQNLKPIP